VKRLEEMRENSLQKVEELGGGSNLRIETDGNSTRTGEKPVNRNDLRRKSSTQQRISP